MHKATHFGISFRMKVLLTLEKNDRNYFRSKLFIKMNFLSTNSFLVISSKFEYNIFLSFPVLFRC